MAWILDIIVIAVVAYYAFISAKRGFVRTLIELVGFIAIFLIITKAGTPMSEKLFDTVFRAQVLSKVETSLQDSAAQTTQALTNALPEFVVNSADFLGINISETVDMSNNTAALASSITDNVIRPVATSLIYAVISLLLFGLGMYLVRVLARAVNSLFKISFVGVVNRVLGAVLGAGKGLVVAFVLCMLITVTVSFTENGFWVFTKENIEQSFIFGRIAEWNPLYK
ncbi:MAG: CvpA family protein [Clostridia bacterium]|nr:CvpA family protein [Clostridia bacterium]MBQ7289061.1 CvpA family protein [Clostridia bacterium]